MKSSLQRYTVIWEPVSTSFMEMYIAASCASNLIRTIRAVNNQSAPDQAEVLNRKCLM